MDLSKNLFKLIGVNTEEVLQLQFKISESENLDNFTKKDYELIYKLSGGDLFGSPDAGSLVGDTVSIYILEDAYPKVIAEQELSYGSKNEYMTLTVEFSYAKWSHSLSSISNLIGSAAINALDAAERALF